MLCQRIKCKNIILYVTTCILYANVLLNMHLVSVLVKIVTILKFLTCNFNAFIYKFKRQIYKRYYYNMSASRININKKYMFYY